MVEIVTTPNTTDTSKTPLVLYSAAGKISTGINGSQGPSTKMANKIQGIMFLYHPAREFGRVYSHARVHARGLFHSYG